MDIQRTEESVFASANKNISPQVRVLRRAITFLGEKHGCNQDALIELAAKAKSYSNKLLIAGACVKGFDADEALTAE